jgi:hypothetical protein
LLFTRKEIKKKKNKKKRKRLEEKYWIRDMGIERVDEIRREGETANTEKAHYS